MGSTGRMLMQSAAKVCAITECVHPQPHDGSSVAAVGGVNGTARSAARVATPRVKPQPEAARPVPTAPLTAVVHDAVRRWFQEAHKEAQRGDVVSNCLSMPTDLPVQNHRAGTTLLMSLCSKWGKKTPRAVQWCSSMLVTHVMHP